MSSLVTLPPASSPDFKLNIKPPSLETLTAFRPDKKTVEVMSAKAKEIFKEAFTTSYTSYHKESGSTDSIEKWLRLNPKYTAITEWLEATFDEEYTEYQEGKKGFIYLIDSKNELIGWLSHGPVSEKGELYLSQCSLEADWRNLKVASTAFSEAFENDRIKNMFPGLVEVKLIVRKINKIAEALYSGAGFTRDETIDPAIYGESYDDRYVGYRIKPKFSEKKVSE